MYRNFLWIEPQYYSLEKARFTVIPVPHEETTSYVKGTRRGPAAILRASQHVEGFDEELGYETYKKDLIYTLNSITLKGLEHRLPALIKKKKIPVILGGEHSISPVAVRVLARQHDDLSVLQLDAHADLRDSYEGKKESHACVMRRILETCPAVQVGVRNISREGWEFAQETGQIDKIHWARKIELVEKIENQLSKNVYITIDVDVFDPSLVPATGTPEPGGMFWYEVLDILSRVCRDKNVVGFDVMELSPLKVCHASDFTVAKLVYKIMGYISAKRK